MRKIDVSSTNNYWFSVAVFTSELFFEVLFSHGWPNSPASNDTNEQNPSVEEITNRSPSLDLKWEMKFFRPSNGISFLEYSTEYWGIFWEPKK